MKRGRIRMTRRQITSAAALPSPIGDTFWEHLDAVAVAGVRASVTGTRHRVRRRRARMGMHGGTRPWVWYVEPIETFE